MFLSIRSTVLSWEKYLGLTCDFFCRLTLLRSCFSCLYCQNLSACWSSRLDMAAFCLSWLLACEAMVLMRSLHCPSICLQCFDFCRYISSLFLKCSCMRCFKSALICADRVFSYYYLRCWLRWTCWWRVTFLLMRRISSECLSEYLRRGCGMIRWPLNVTRERERLEDDGLHETIRAQLKSSSLWLFIISYISIYRTQAQLSTTFRNDGQRNYWGSIVIMNHLGKQKKIALRYRRSFILLSEHKSHSLPCLPSFR